MPDLYLKNPKTGEVEVFDEKDAQAASNAGYQPVDQATFDAARQHEIGQAGQAGAVKQGLLQAPAGYNTTNEFLGKVVSGATFGLGAPADAESQAYAKRYQEEHPYASAGAEMLGQTPGVLLGGAAGQAVRGAAAGAGLAARAGAFAADIGLNAAVGGAQIEGERARVEGEDFNYTNLAVSGVLAETIGRTGAWGVSKAVGGARNLITRAARDVVATDAERSLTKGGWLGDYRVAQHSEAYHDELARLGADDLDRLETSTAEVGRQDKKRARIMRSVVENPAAQHEINVQALDGLQRLRGALEGELADAPGGPAKRLAKQLDDRIASLDQAPKGRKLWKVLDENRQALQEYRQDLHQAYDSNPGSAWLSREGLAAIDAAEEATRTALLREDAWGEAAARMQREYNVPFHEKWFPARQTVLKDLHFATGKDAQGFTTFRGEPGKMRKFLTALGGTGPDTHRLGEQFTQYLDGAEAIARAGEKDSPKAAREALESVRRLRKNLAQSTFINAAAERTASRGAVAGVVGAAAAGGVGLAVGGPIGGAGGVLAARSARLGHWFGQVANRLGMFRGEAVSMAELLTKDALPAAAKPAEDLASKLADDILDAPFPEAPSARPPAPGGPIAGEAPRGVGVAAPPEPPEGVFPGPGQVGRQETPRRPAGMEAITPQSVRGVGPEAPPPRRGGFTPMERPESLRASERVPEGSEAPSIHEGAEVPLPGEVHVNETPTFPTPYRTEGAADLEARLAPHAGAQSREAARMQALTEGEFAEVVQGLNATGQKGPDGSPLGDFLAKHGDDLKSAGLVAAGAGATAAAAEYEQEPGVAGAAAGGLALLAAGRMGKRLPGAWFAGHSPAVQQALHGLEKLGFETSQPVATRLMKTFGDRMPTPAHLEKMIPIRALEGLGGPAVEQKIIKLGNEVHWYAESAESPMPPHDVHLPDGTVDRDEGGYPAPAWKMARTFDKGPNGDLIVKHDYFYLRHDLQGSGVGAKILKDQMEAYRDLGVKTVEVSCDDVGRYFWPSIGFDSADKSVVDKAVRAYENFVVQKKLATPAEVRAEAGTIKSLPRLANAEFGKEFLLSKPGDWNLHLELNLDEADPRFHLMRQRLGLGEAALGGGLALAGAIEGKEPSKGGEAAQAGGLGMGFLGAAALFKQSRAKLVSDVARTLFSPTAGRALARVVARQVYTRADMAKRQQEFQSWAEHPEELVERVAEGFRDVPPEHQADVHAGVFRAATFLKERLPAVTKTNAISMRDLPVSAEQMAKFAKYEQAALKPRDAWSEGAARGHLSPELLETTEALHPDLLAEIRVQAYLSVRDEGPPISVQAKLQYAKLFDGHGEFADPSMAPEVANMALMAYAAAVPAKAGGGPSSSGGTSHVAAASGAPAGLAKLG